MFWCLHKLTLCFKKCSISARTFLLRYQNFKFFIYRFLDGFPYIGFTPITIRKSFFASSIFPRLALEPPLLQYASTFLGSTSMALLKSKSLYQVHLIFHRQALYCQYGVENLGLSSMAFEKSEVASV